MAGNEISDYKTTSSGGGFGNRIGWVRYQPHPRNQRFHPY